MAATRNVAFNSKGAAEILHVRIVGGFAQYPHSCPVSAGWLDFWTEYDFSEKLSHIYFGLNIKKKLTEVKWGIWIEFRVLPPI